MEGHSEVLIGTRLQFQELELLQQISAYHGDDLSQARLQLSRALVMRTVVAQSSKASSELLQNTLALRPFRQQLQQRCALLGQPWQVVHNGWLRRRLLHRCLRLQCLQRLRCLRCLSSDFMRGGQGLLFHHFW